MKPFKFIQNSPIFFPLACIAVIIMVLISEISYWQSVDALDDLGSMGEAHTNIQNFQLSILDAETGQRGYLITNRKEYLEPYNKARKSIDASFVVLDAYYKNSPSTAEAFAVLRALSQAKLSELEETIRLHDAGKNSAATELVLSDIGKEKMDAIRTLSSQLMQHETKNVANSRIDVYRTLMLRRISVAVLSILSLLALYLYLRQTFSLKRHQLDLKNLLLLERDKLGEEVAQRTAQLTELTSHLHTAREDERNRLARNLHDDLGSLLTSAKLDTARIRSRLTDATPETHDLLTHMVGTLNSSIALGRRIIEDLRPSALSNLGLEAALEILTREFTEQTGILIDCQLQAVTLKPSTELLIYRLVQEAITNITKYAQAGHVWVSLSNTSGQIEVSVRDDGIGFDTTIKPHSKYGLIGMRFRVEAEGGVLTVASSPGHGTKLSALLPQLARENS